MKTYYYRMVVQAVVQMMAMIFCMRVVRWDIFLSAGVSAIFAGVVSWVLYLSQKSKSSNGK